MRDSISNPSQEESKGRIKTDNADRNALLEKLETSIDPLYYWIKNLIVLYWFLVH